MAQYILGLDLGTNSVGWALLRCDATGSPCGIEKLGVRIFEAGTDGTATDFRKGKDSSRATTRRKKRAARRTSDRRARRMKKVFLLLQRAGFIRAGANHSPLDRDYLIKQTDHDLRLRWIDGETEAHQHTLPYLLRAKAVSQPLDAESLGRALYHLAQRRGYRSNRKADRSASDKDLGTVKQGIEDLRKEMAAAGCSYLGRYFATLDPRTVRIRKRWTSREMYEDEFARIIEVQKPHHPVDN